MNKLSGVVGVFNCQGAGSWLMKQVAQEVTNLTSTAKPLSARISPLNVEFLEEVAGGDWSGDCAVYAFNSGLTHDFVTLIITQIGCLNTN